MSDEKMLNGVPPMYPQDTGEHTVAITTATLDEARMREIVLLIVRGHVMRHYRSDDRDPYPPAYFSDELIHEITTAMSRAISEARAEQIELDAKIAGYFAEIYWGLSPAKSAAAATAAAIRSQNDPDKQGE